ncbi:signal peptidase I [Streptomyces sp. CB01881]|uniref:signal peptidase I n=1 Tax=Streptomyces sp. CB01881 TaxID=2078691 RepID=UPI000CDC8E64|nr:signal peptidase I [Streptomyces sp. CB01881]AUY54188.1 signal peptidase I [Streptomyces sp. CB01881]TYC73063.1 signal peptidase I [Streptomyces sp. CB01881]
MGTRGRGRLADRSTVKSAAGPSEPTAGTAGTADPQPPASARGRAERRRTARRAARRRRRSLLREFPLIVLVALVVALVMKTFMVQVFVIPSGSMEQTIQIGDRVLVDKFTPWFGAEPERGEVVVFKDPGGWLEADHKPSTDGPVLRGAKQVLTYVGLLPSESEQDLIKRVIGIGGDTVECCDDQGRLSVNGSPVNEPYLAPGNPPSRQPFKVKVPEGRLWVMGDHRDVSADSRFHMGNEGQGTIPLSGVVGRAFVIAWPVGRVHQLDVPGSLSKVASAPQTRGTTANSMGVGPLPAEPPLVMGALGILPLVGRRPERSPA